MPVKANSPNSRPVVPTAFVAGLSGRSNSTTSFLMIMNSPLSMAVQAIRRYNRTGNTLVFSSRLDKHRSQKHPRAWRMLNDKRLRPAAHVPGELFLPSNQPILCAASLARSHVTSGDAHAINRHIVGGSLA